MTFPLCRDCRFCDHVSLVASRCTNPDALADQLTAGRADIVDGRHTDVIGRCWSMRAGPCGVEGKHFKARVKSALPPISDPRLDAQTALTEPYERTLDEDELRAFGRVSY